MMTSTLLERPDSPSTTTGLPDRGSPTDDDRPGQGEPDLAGLSVADLARELGSLAAGIAAANARFLRLLAEFDRREGWAAEGVSSATHWLSWRCGMSTTTAREQVRVARRLADLPRTAEKFADGRLSYSKVRAITRVATTDTELELLEIADAATANQLDRFVAGVQTAMPLKTVNERHSRRYLTFRHDADGSVSFSGRCSPEEGAAILEQLRIVQDHLARSGGSAVGRDEAEAPDVVEQVPQGRALIDALVLLCTESEVGAGADPLTAEEAIGSRRSETVLHITLDELQTAIDAGAERAGMQTAGAASGAGAGDDASAEAGEREGTDVSEGGPLVVGPRLEHGSALHPETARRLCCDTGVVISFHKKTGRFGVVPNGRPGRTLDLGRRRRLASRKQLRALWDRDHGCRFPGCERRRYLHAHHIRHWADGGPTDLDNLVLLCSQHHRLLHEGEYSIELTGATVTVLDPTGRRLDAVPSEPGPFERDDTEPGGTELDHTERDHTEHPLFAAFGLETPPEYALDPVEGGPLNLEYAVGVVAERWEMRDAG